METTYALTLTTGNSNHTETLDVFATLEEARQALAERMESCANRSADFIFFANSQQAQDELDIFIANLASGDCDWDEGRVRAYTGALKEGISKSAPFMVDSTCGIMVSCDCDCFGYDNENYNIKKS